MGRRPLLCVVSATLLVALTAPAQSPAARRSVTRTQATAIALKALGARHQRNVIVFAMPARLPRGAWLLDLGGLERQRRAALTRPAWLFWEDLAPYQGFEHPSIAVLVDAQSGHVTEQPMTMLPAIDGRRAPFVATLSGYDGSRYRVFDSVAGDRATRATTRQAPGYPHRGQLKKRPAVFQHDCLVAIGPNDPHFTGDRKALAGWAGEVGMAVYEPGEGQTPSLDTLKALLRNAEGSDDRCTDVFLFIDGHGSAPPPDQDPRPDGTVLVEGLPKPTVDPTKSAVHKGDILSGPAQINVDPSYELHGRKITDNSSYITLDALNALIAGQSEITFKVKIDACFAGRFAPLTKNKNVLVLETSAAADETSSSQLPNGEKLPRTDGKGHAADGTVTNTAANPDDAGVFTNANVYGLYQWWFAHMDDASPTLVDGVTQSRGLGESQNITDEAGWTHSSTTTRSGTLTGNGTGSGTGPGSGTTPGGTTPGGTTPTPAPAPPKPNFKVPGNSPPASPKSGQGVSFDGSSSVAQAPGATITQYSWGFGDGTSATGETVMHTYAAPGAYTVTLTTTDSNGSVASTTDTLFVSGPGTKDADLADLDAGVAIPCPDSTSAETDVTVEIHIPSYAQSPHVAVKNAISCNANFMVGTLAVTRQTGNTAAIRDAWGNLEDTLVITFNVTGNMTGSPSTMTGVLEASWQ